MKSKKAQTLGIGIIVAIIIVVEIVRYLRRCIIDGIKRIEEKRWNPKIDYLKNIYLISL